MLLFSQKILRTVPGHVFTSLRCYARNVKLSSEALKTTTHNIDSIANNVSVSMNPRGQNDISGNFLKSPNVPKSHVSVPEVIELRKKLKYFGSKLLTELAYKIDESHVDSETTATTLTHSIAKASFEKIAAGASPTEIRRGIMLAVNEVLRRLKALSRPISTPEEIEGLVNKYAHNDTSITKVLCDALSKVSRDGIISVRKGKGQNDEVEIVEGMKLDCGYISPFFINTLNEDKVEFQNALLLLTSAKVSSMRSLMPAVELASSTRTPLVIIADDIIGQALKFLVISRMKAELRVAALKAPSYGENKRAILKDIAISTGGVVLSDNSDTAHLGKVQLSDLGKVGNVIITKYDTLLLNGVGKRENIVQRIDEIKEQIAKLTTPFKKRNLRERLTNLISGIVLIHVGGANELKVNEKIQRINVALNATRAAMEEGIVPGSGIALLKCMSALDSVDGCTETQRMGIEIVRRALRIPFQKIATKAGIEAAQIISHVENEKVDLGWDTLKEDFANLIEMGMVDPTKFVRTAITDAAGVATLLMTTEHFSGDNEILKGKLK